MPPDTDSVVALDILRDLADKEISRSERSATRARQAFALAAGFYAVVQTVALGSFGSTLVSSHERMWMLYLAALGGFFLAACGVALLFADRAFRARNLSSDNVLEAVNAGRTADESVTDRLVELYATALDEMRGANANRGKVVVASQVTALLALTAVLVELVYALHARLS